MTAPTQPPPTRLPVGLVVASTLAWLWGILLAFTGVALTIATVAHDGVFSSQLAFDLLILAAALALCVAGHGLRKREREAGRDAITVGALLVLVPLLVRVQITIIGAVVNLAIVGLTLANWHHLSGARKRGRSAAVR
jgi:drug/metabolite transporter (DMT)-like permease